MEPKGSLKQPAAGRGSQRRDSLAVVLVGLVCCALLVATPLTSHAISLKPADFDRLIMPCYLGAREASMQDYRSEISPSTRYADFASSSLTQLGRSGTNGAPVNGQRAPAYFGSSGGAQTSPLATPGGESNDARSTFTSAAASLAAGPAYRDSLTPNLGQRVPRANTIDNFIALVAKLEAANPRLANNLNQLIRTLLSRFRLDNYYFNVREKTSIAEQDHRNDVQTALFGLYSGSQQQAPYLLPSDVFPEHLLDHDEKCSMYFMLSHFIDKSTPLSQSLANSPVPQLAGPLNGQRPPFLQAAGAGYPAQSANQAYGGGAAAGPRYPGPAPSFGSPATSNMNGFGSGISNTPDYTGNNPLGMNVPQANNQLFNQNYNNLRQTGQYSGTLSSNSRYSTPYLDGQARPRDEKVALEFGVVSVGGQENAALALNRVLLGLLAASTPPQTIRQLASLLYPIQSVTNTPKIDEEIDPLFAVTLADLWAVSAIPKAGKPFDVHLMGDNGRWNDTMCPTSFQLNRPNNIRFTTAELLGGLDGFSLGMFARRLMSLGKNIRLSELLRMYYSRNGFRPQFSEVGVCNRGSALSSHLDELTRQAENYLRLYQLNLPTSDSELAMSLHRLDAFKEVAKHAAVQLAPPEVCSNSDGSSGYDAAYPTSAQDQCEIAKADISFVLDTSPQANEPFMNLVVGKFAQKLGLSRVGNSLSVLTNQQDSTGYAGGYSFNAVVRNSTNTAEIGCALMHDTSRSYQGGQMNDPTRLIEMFERALMNLDSEYLVRQNTGASPGSSSSSRPSSYVSSLFGSENHYSYLAATGHTKNTAGAKVIIWFNYGSVLRPAQIGSSPTNWQTPSGGYRSEEYQYKFIEAKRFLRENFRGASVLAVSGNREDVKAFVYDEERDIFTDIPQADGASQGTSGTDYYPSRPALDATTISILNGPADQLVGKLLQRICDIPAVFQYPMCFRAPSDNALSIGYISPGRRQNWMMSPKTFFASKTVRVIFKVDGGRLRVCFGRMPNPEESAIRYAQQNGGQTGISFGGGASSSNPSGGVTQTTIPSSGDYYTGLEYGICKDVSPGQEIDFVVQDPCYKKPIAECEPFYYVIKETSNPGEGDPNYMCRDEGCKRLDQVRFTMAHTGVTCSAASPAVKVNWLLIMISILTTLGISKQARHFNLRAIINSSTRSLPVLISASIYLSVQQVQAQQAAPHDFGQGRYGEKRGNFTPSEIMAIILLVMTIIAGLALTIGLCYYVTRRNNRGMREVEQDDY